MAANAEFEVGYECVLGCTHTQSERSSALPNKAAAGSSQPLTDTILGAVAGLMQPISFFAFHLHLPSPRHRAAARPRLHEVDSRMAFTHTNLPTKACSADKIIYCICLSTCDSQPPQRASAQPTRPALENNHGSPPESAGGISAIAVLCLSDLCRYAVTCFQTACTGRTHLTRATARGWLASAARNRLWFVAWLLGGAWVLYHYFPGSTS